MKSVPANFNSNSLFASLYTFIYMYIHLFTYIVLFLYTIANILIYIYTYISVFNLILHLPRLDSIMSLWFLLGKNAELFVHLILHQVLLEWDCSYGFFQVFCRILNEKNKTPIFCWPFFFFPRKAPATSPNSEPWHMMGCGFRKY